MMDNVDKHKTEGSVSEDGGSGLMNNGSGSAVFLQSRTSGVNRPMNCVVAAKKSVPSIS